MAGHWQASLCPKGYSQGHVGSWGGAPGPGYLEPPQCLLRDKEGPLLTGGQHVDPIPRSKTVHNIQPASIRLSLSLSAVLARSGQVAKPWEEGAEAAA